MRFICMLLTLLAVLISIFLGFTINSENNNLKKLDTGIVDLHTIQNTFETDINILSNDITTLTAIRDDLLSEVNSLKEILKYKSQPTAFLTFDDGPSQNTMKILDILKQYNIKATFFVVGTRISEGGKTALERIVEEGHTIGVHAYEHDYKTLYSSKEAFFADLEKVENLIFEYTGVKPEVARLPGGTSSAIGFCKKYGGSDTLFREIMDELAARGYTVNDWNIDTEDYTSKTGVEKIKQNAVDGAKNRLKSEYKTALILMHDSKDTTAALSSIIDELRFLGYSFENLKKDSYSYRHYS